MQRIMPYLAAASVAVLKLALARMRPGDRAWLARRLMRDRFAPAEKAFATFCELSVHAWKNRQYDVRLNGEEALLRRLAPFRPRIVFDVGANVGEWSLNAARLLADATIHAFEIAPETARTLAANAAAAGRIVVNPIGLSDRSGTVTIYLDPADSTSTSTVEIEDPGGGRRTMVRNAVATEARVTTGDAYLEAAGIEAIDLLKIDVEGAEKSVLDGFAGTFARGGIGMVQFEYGVRNAQTGVLLKHFYRFFTERGFVLGKIYPEGVAFKDYAFEDEDFVGPNYLAVHRSRAEAIDALRCPVP